MGYSSLCEASPFSRCMDHKAAAEELPGLYRAILDRIAQIDAAGHRSLAYRIRTDATRIYSRAWDDRARRGLESLLRETADKTTPQRPPFRGTARRSAPLA
jgi:hypothetical protein